MKSVVACQKARKGVLSSTSRPRWTAKETTEKAPRNRTVANQHKHFVLVSDSIVNQIIMGIVTQFYYSCGIREQGYRIVNENHKEFT